MPGTRGEAIRVAIVEDNELMLDGVQFLLEQHGDLQVIAAVRSGTEALALAAQGDLDVMVLDMGLPDLDGSEVLRHLRQQPEPPRVVVCSAYSDEDTRRQALNGGADAFVVKDRIAEELPAAIRRSAAASAP